MATRTPLLASLLQRLRLRLRRRSKASPAEDDGSPVDLSGDKDQAEPALGQTPANSVQPQAKAWNIDDLQLVFGMRWSPISKDARLGTQLQQARRSGFAYHVVSQQGSTLGLIGSPSKHRAGTMHSVAMVLSEHFSTSGAELFVFEHEGQFALVGLADNNPTPGFDTQGSREEIEALVDEFMAMNTGQSIRLAGNVNWLPDMADLQPTQVAERANKRSRLQIIQNPNLKIGLAVLTLLVFSGLGFAYYQLEIVRSQRESLKNIIKNPNAKYEESISAALSGVRPGGSGVLSLWRDTLKTVPMEVAGWELRSLRCKADQCTASWARASGNFAEFDGNFPYASKQRPALVPAEKNEQLLETEHPAAARQPAVAPASPRPAQGLQRASLPLVRDAYLQWGSFILDAQLIPNQSASLRAATLFGGEGPVQDIRKPVLKGNWQLESDLWTLKDLRLPPYVVAESLAISRSGGSAASAGAGAAAGDAGASRLGAPASKNLGYRYKIEGSFYANAR
jgi:hypothetical protein